MAHWTEELFSEHPELFLGFFSSRQELAPDEVKLLLKRLRAHKIRPERVLDLNCGIGRHTVELGQHGLGVLGTDISKDYIELARAASTDAGVADKVSFQVADMRRISAALAGEAAFDGIVCLWTSFGFYDDATNEDILTQCLKLVRPGGFFALDIINRDWLVSHYTEQGFRRDDRGLVLEDRYYNPYTARNYSRWTFYKQVDAETLKLNRVIELDHRIWSLHEQIEMFQRAGWEFEAVYPGFAAGFASGSMTAEDEDEILSNPMLLTIYRRV